VLTDAAIARATVVEGICKNVFCCDGYEGALLDDHEVGAMMNLLCPNGHNWRPVTHSERHARDGMPIRSDRERIERAV
jgi:hypothetical protein